jgi:ubiquinone/menaquinone biosynthesis C-methylase UbiE
MLQAAEEALKQTIQSYDRTATSYAERTAIMPMPEQRERFMELLATPAGRILDLGCGPGRDTRFYRERAYSVTGVDLSGGMLAEARRRVPGGQFIQADMRRLPLRSASFNGLWASASLLHLPKHSAGLALAEMQRVLAGNGLLFLAVKQGTAESWREPEGAGPRFYFAYYEAEELARKVEQAGFEILSLSENHSQVQRHPDGSPVRWINLYARKVSQ